MMMEMWRPIVNYEGIYEVSSLGRVKRVKRVGTRKDGSCNTISEMIMKEDEKEHFVVLHKDGEYKNKSIRSLVAQAFLNIPYGEPVSHINRNIGDARVENLISTEEFRKLDPDWKDIPGFEGDYQVSRYGQVRSVDRFRNTHNGIKYCVGVIKALDSNNDGYLQVGLYRDGKSVKTCGVHQYVAQAFIPNPENKPTVNHIDGDKHNNCVENLEWATYSEQQEHATRTGLRKKSYWNASIHGPVGGSWNATRQIKVRCVETGLEYPSMSAAGVAIGASASEIKQSVDNHKLCRGLHFVRANLLDYDTNVASLEGEQWLPIPGYEGLYEMSNLKRVKNLQRTVKCAKGFRTAPEKLLSTKYRLTLNRNGVSSTFSIDELYAKVWIINSKGAAIQ